MRVLLTGAGGFAGSHCLEHILETTDWDVVCTDSFRHKGKTNRITEIRDACPDGMSRVSVVTHDLRVPFSSQTIREIGHVDYVLAYASESHVERSITDPVPFVMNNVEVALSTLEYARMVKPRAVMWISTDEVYGPELDRRPYKEWSPIVPSNPYAASKAMQEALCISYWRTYAVPVEIINCMNMIGERQDIEKFVPKVIKACLTGDEIVIHGRPGNVGSRHYLHVRNLADGILFLLRKRTPTMHHDHVPSFDVHSDDKPDRFNIASPDEIDNLTLALSIADLVGKPLSWRFEDFSTSRPGHDAHYGLDPGKITDMGWVPPVPFSESLRKTVEWTLEHQEWLL